MARKKKNKFNQPLASAISVGGTNASFLHSNPYGACEEISLEISPEPSKGLNVFRARMTGDVERGSWIIEWTKEDLVAEANDLLRLSRGLTDISCTSELVEEVARTGYSHFTKLFPTQRHRDAILRSIDHCGARRIAVISSAFIYPWGLLYTKNPNDGIDPVNFLGLRSVFFRRIDDTFSEDLPLHYKMSIDADQAEVCYAWHSELTYASSIEVPHIELLSGQGHIKRVFEVPALRDNDGTSHNIQTFRDCLNDRSAGLLHLACHAENGAADRQRFITVRNSTRLTERDLKMGNFQLSKNPIVFLNACRLGFPEPGHFASFIRFLENSGARSVLAPECEIGDQCASEFAKTLLDEIFIQRNDVCEALLNTRLSRYKSSGDLTGLTYALYGRPDSLIQKEEAA